MARKVTTSIPFHLCRLHHRELHRLWKRTQLVAATSYRSAANRAATLAADKTKWFQPAMRLDRQPASDFIRQFEANRRNARRSTGPKTEEGKRRSRRNAVRHGLCAETVIDIVEDVGRLQRILKRLFIADYDARTVVEREMVLRLASLLWRIRRATSIETDLLRIKPKYCASTVANQTRPKVYYPVLEPKVH